MGGTKKSGKCDFCGKYLIFSLNFTMNLINALANNEQMSTVNQQQCEEVDERIVATQMIMCCIWSDSRIIYGQYKITPYHHQSLNRNKTMCLSITQIGKYCGSLYICSHFSCCYQYCGELRFKARCKNHLHLARIFDSHNQRIDRITYHLQFRFPW